MGLAGIHEMPEYGYSADDALQLNEVMMDMKIPNEEVALCDEVRNVLE